MNSRRIIFLSALRDPDATVRARAAEALDRFDLSESLPQILREAGSYSRAEWVALLRALQPLRGETCLKLAVHALTHAEADVRVAALELIEALGDWRSTSNVTRCLGDPATVVRVRAAATLGVLGDRRAGAALMERLGDSSSEVIAAAAQALGRLGHGAAEEPLSALANHADAEVRASAVLALGRLELRASVLPL